MIGAGHGGQAMAGHLALKGYEVNLYNRTWERVMPVRARGGVELDGEVRGFGRIRLATADAQEALEGVDVVMVAVPASAHRWVAETFAPFLTDGQIVLLNPGRTGGALEFRNVMREKGVSARLTLAEAGTFLYASRSMGPGQSRIYRIKNAVPVAALPATRTQLVIETLHGAFPQFIPASSILKTSLDNMGAVFHPTITLLNSGWIEATQGDFEYYFEGVTPSVARVLEAVDGERVRVARALGVDALSAREWLEMAYGATGDTLHEAMHNNEGYQGIKAPAMLRHRYLSEDIPASMVPIASLGQMLGVPTPMIETMVNLASAVHDVDYWATGRTVEKLGIAGMSREDIERLVMDEEVA